MRLGAAYSFNSSSACDVALPHLSCRHQGHHRLEKIKDDLSSAADGVKHTRATYSSAARIAVAQSDAFAVADFERIVSFPSLRGRLHEPLANSSADASIAVYNGPACAPSAPNCTASFQVVLLLGIPKRSVTAFVLFFFVSLKTALPTGRGGGTSASGPRWPPPLVVPALPRRSRRWASRCVTWSFEGGHIDAVRNGIASCNVMGITLLDQAG
ncbi:hypothetical protein ABL78_2107 [Leptomonas seymouri]|uniref:Uncharacterized protein n=1 Tax=Leptomonas seymouri TaxID=5684 RepID=A0A0N1I6J0_LEPSE|nr:hypothetical protein ABL78_2107 [Leptomonas seymouri]|eukprot:KPI88792.1 hypothetical protein ABL78_2107 [Leptomonas seymouri]